MIHGIVFVFGLCYVLPGMCCVLPGMCYVLRGAVVREAVSYTHLTLPTICSV